MYNEKVELNNIYPNINKSTLEINIPSDIDFSVRTKPALLILPGGGYNFCSNREKDPIALSFMLKNYACFTLTYSVTGDGSKSPLYPQPQLQAIASLHYIKVNAERLHVDKNKIFVVGFSAGGHLAGTLGYLYRDKELLNMLGLDSVDLKPNGICLAYPVITFKEKTHGGSRDTLIGNNVELIDKLSIENGVGSDYPPTFVWATKEDNCVPIANSYLMKEALDKNQVKNKLMMFEKGPHGLSIATDYVCDKTYEEAAVWVDEVDKFFKDV